MNKEDSYTHFLEQLGVEQPKEPFEEFLEILNELSVQQFLAGSWSVLLKRCSVWDAEALPEKISTLEALLDDPIRLASEYEQSMPIEKGFGFNFFIERRRRKVDKFKRRLDVALSDLERGVCVVVFDWMGKKGTVTALPLQEDTMSPEAIQHFLLDKAESLGRVITRNDDYSSEDDLSMSLTIEFPL